MNGACARHVSSEPGCAPSHARTERYTTHSSPPALAPTSSFSRTLSAPARPPTLAPLLLPLPAPAPPVRNWNMKRSNDSKPLRCQAG